MISIQGKAIKWDLKDAQELIPLLLSITNHTVSKYNRLAERINYLAHCGLTYQAEREHPKVEAMLKRWQEKLFRLGVYSAAPFTVEFDFGNGLYCWRYPEKELKYWHAYDDVTNRFTIMEAGSGEVFQG